MTKNREFTREEMLSLASDVLETDFAYAARDGLVGAQYDGDDERKVAIYADDGRKIREKYDLKKWRSLESFVESEIEEWRADQ